VPPRTHEPKGLPQLGAVDRERLLAEFVGPNWGRHYRASFTALRGTDDWWRGHWNWAAATVPFWLLWRHLGVHQIAAWIAFVSVSRFFLSFYGTSKLTSALIVAYGAVAVVEGYWGDRWLFARAQRVIGVVQARRGVDQPGLKIVTGNGRVSFLAPALICVLFAVWFFGEVVPTQGLFGVNASRYDNGMKYALSDLAAAEARFFAERGIFTANLADSVRSESDSSTWKPLSYGYREIALTVTLLGADGWYATARHRRTARICEVWVGTAPAHLLGTAQGAPSCRKP
jgi:hypothetical protein